MDVPEQEMIWDATFRNPSAPKQSFTQPLFHPQLPIVPGSASRKAQKPRSPASVCRNENGSRWNTVSRTSQNITAPYRSDAGNASR